MKKLSLLVILTLSTQFIRAELSEDKINQIAAAIYKIEGGEKTKFPYGIKSINTGGNKELAERICKNSIRNQYRRWKQSGEKITYFESLRNRYCPLNDKNDKNGLNQNWLNNLRRLCPEVK